MADPYRKMQPGDDASFSAVAWNAVLDAGRALKGQFGGIQTPGPTSTPSSTIIRVLNDSGADQPRYAIMTLNGPVFTPADSSLDAFLRGDVVLRAVNPRFGIHRSRFVVLDEPAPANRVVRAFIAGVCRAKVDIIDESHEYCNPIDNDTTHLKSSRRGHTQIIWREGDEAYGYGAGYNTGLQWAIVMLGAASIDFAIGRANGNIGARSDNVYGVGRVDLYRAHPGEDGPLETITVFNASAEEFAYGVGIEDGTRVSVAWDADDTAWVAPLECSNSPYAYG